MVNATSISKKEIITALKNNSATTLEIADNIRKKHCGNEVHIRGIIEFSNFCSRDCLYCGLRKSNIALPRYRMSENEIIQHAKRIIRSGVKTVVLQSGDDCFYSREKLAKIISKIKKNSDIAVTLSVGERPFDDYRAFRDAGADRYLIKHETSNEKIYKTLHPGQNLKHRLKILRFLKKLGFQTGSGFIIGLPAQTTEDIANDILLIKDLDCDMAGIGPFLPHKDTPLANCPKGNFELTLTALALTRILTKNVHLPVTTAIASLKPLGQVAALKAGGNVIMPNFTNEHFSKKYKIYDNKKQINLQIAKKTIHQAGRIPGATKGDSLKHATHA